MDDERYTISQTEKLTGIRGHVLRYWEEELGLRIGRNAMGYRCYTRYDIQLFLNIRELKNRGLQLKAIKELIPRIHQYGPGSPGSKIQLLTQQGEPVEVFEQEESQEAYDARMQEFLEILERLISQCLKKPTHEERRCRSLDEAIRLHQLSRKEAAATKEQKRRTSRLRRKNKNR